MMSKCITSASLVACLAVFLIGVTGLNGTDYEVQVEKAEIYAGDQVIGSYQRGTQFSSSQENNGWVLTSFKGKAGWVASKDIKIINTPKLPSSIPLKVIEWEVLSTAELNAKAEARDPEAMFEIGRRYTTGDRSHQIDTEAYAWYRRAGERGHSMGQYNAGLMCEKGVGTKQDYTASVKWYRMAAAQGNVHAKIGLGQAYFNGLGVSKNRTEASKWYRMAAEQGHAGAQSMLGAMYMDGDGVAQSNTEAIRWLRKAVKQGDKNGKIMLDLLEGR